jgi:hypothetical protein
MTDQGSTRASVSIAWRLVDLRVWMFLAEPRRCHAEVTELARPAAAPPTAVAPEENPLLDEYPLRADGAPAAPAGAVVGDVAVGGAEVE